MTVGKTHINPLLSSASSSSSWGSSPSSSPFPSQPTDSTQKRLGVYLDISTTNDTGELLSQRGLTVNHPPEAYTFYRSVTGRLERLKFEEQGRVRVNLREIKRRLFYINRRLERWDIPDEERSALLEERSRLTQTAKHLLSFVQSHSVLYGDSFIIDVPKGYSQLLHYLGINPSDADISAWVTSSVVDIEFDDSSKSALKLAYISRVIASKYHPVKGFSKGSQEAKRLVRDFLILQKFLDGIALTYHKGGYVTANSLLPGRSFVLTAPKEVSNFIWSELRSGDDSALKTFKLVSAKTIKDFLWYLVEKYSLPISKRDAVFGFVLNIHPTGDQNPFVPHFHSHSFVLLIVYDKKSKRWFRLNPVLTEEDLQKLREFLKANLIDAFGGVISEDTLKKDFNVYVGERYYSLPADYVDVIFELKYNARKMFVNFARHYESNSFNPNFDKEFVDFVFSYDNRTERYGFLTNLKRYLSDVSLSAIQKRRDELSEFLERIESDLSVLDPEQFPAMYNALVEKAEVIRSEISLLDSALSDSSNAFKLLYSEFLKEIEDLLSNQRITEERIINVLEGLFGKRIIGYKFIPIEEDIPLSRFLESNPSVVLLSDRHKTIEFMLFRDPFWEDPPNFDEIVISRNS